jgi:hypothetical protein
MTAPVFAPGKVGEIFLTGDADRAHPSAAERHRKSGGGRRVPIVLAANNDLIYNAETQDAPP